MQRCLWGCGAAVVVVSQPAVAWFVRTFVADAHSVVVGTVTSVQRCRTSEVPVARGDGTTFTRLYADWVAEVSVAYCFLGQPPTGPLRVHFQSIDLDTVRQRQGEGFALSHRPMEQLSRATFVMLFFKPGPKAEVLEFRHPEWSGNVILCEPGLDQGGLEGLRPFRKVMMQLLHNARSAKEEIVRPSLTAIGSVGSLLGGQRFPQRRWRDFAKAEELTKFAEETIRPALWELSKSESPRTARQALVTVACTQDVKAIPRLADLASQAPPEDDLQDVWGALWNFVKAEAGPVLGPLLLHQRVEVRQGAARALFNAPSKDAIPYLARGLDDTDPEVLYLTVCALELAAAEGRFPLRKDFMADKAPYVQKWKQ